MKSPDHFFVTLWGVEFDVIVVDSVGWVETDHASRLKPLVLDDFLKHNLRVFEQLAGLLTHRLVIKDLRVGTIRVLPSDLPALEEGIPVDVGDQLF